MTDEDAIEILEAFDPCSVCPSRGQDCSTSKCLIVEAIQHCKDRLRDLDKENERDIVTVS